MIATRRAFLTHLGIGAVAVIPMLEVAKGSARPKPKLVPPVHRDPLPTAVEEPAVKPVPPAPTKEVHLHKHPPRRTGADNLRAVHTLNTPGNRQTFALTIWGEARGYGELGMRAVGHVILNRVKADCESLGHGVSGVCRKRKQFSCWNSKDPNRSRMKKLARLDEASPDWQAWVIADKIAARMLAGLDKDTTNGATYYCANSVTPYWRDDMLVVGTMFGHTFFKPNPHASHHHHKRKRHHHRRHHRKVERKDNS